MCHVACIKNSLAVIRVLDSGVHIKCNPVLSLVLLNFAIFQLLPQARIRLLHNSKGKDGEQWSAESTDLNTMNTVLCISQQI